MWASVNVSVCAGPKDEDWGLLGDIHLQDPLPVSGRAPWLHSEDATGEA